MAGITPEQLLAEVEDVLQTMPPSVTLGGNPPESVEWLGRASAIISMWNPSKALLFDTYVAKANSRSIREVADGVPKVLTMLNQARYELRMQTVGPTNVVVPHGMVFDYFDEIRKTIEFAKQDVLFVDPYLDAEFVPRYLPHIAAGVTVRLLGREKLATLLPAVEAFSCQSGTKVEVRSAPNFHDRYVFIDRTSCYQSGASFKDGAKSSPTTLTQITDAFAAILKIYEDLWSQARVER